MQQPKDKIRIYEWRTFSQRIEAVFDFMRLCRRAWFLLVAVLYGPLCVVLTSSAFFRQQDSGDDLGPFEWMVGFFAWTTGPGSAFFICVALLGVWAMFVHVYSLLAAYKDHDFRLDGITLRQLWPYMRASILPSLIPASMLVSILLLMVLLLNRFYDGSTFLLILLVIALAVPLALFPPVSIIERRGTIHALGKAMTMGFKSWFTLAAAIFMVMVFGALMLLSFNMPWMLARMFDAVSSSGEEWWYAAFLRLVSIALTIVAYLSCYMVGAMVQLYCVFHYGYMAQTGNDGMSHSDAVSHFENL